MDDSISQHLREAEERLNEFGSVISNFTNHNPQDEIFEQIKHMKNEIDASLKKHENASSNNQKTVQELEAEKEGLSFKINMDNKGIDLTKDELSHLMKEKLQLKNVPDSEYKALKVKQLEAEDMMFRKHFGMEIRKIKGGCLQVAFSQIDQKQPNSLFLFSLKFDENHQYVVSDCKPPISDLKDLVHNLNMDNDFQKFILTMRKRFKDYLA